MNRSRFTQPEVHFPAAVRIATALVVTVVVVVAPLVSASNVNFNLSMVMFYVVAGLGMNLLTGYAGQVSLGHSAFVALGAYICVLLIRDGWPYLTTLPVAAAACFVVGYLVGRPALRLKGLQLAMVTISLAIITPAAIKRLDRFTHGQEGISINTAHAPAWSGLADDQWLFYVCLVVTVLLIALTRRLASGRTGRALAAIRDNEAVSTTLGIRPATAKAQTFAISAAFAGIAGALYAFLVQFVAPDSFGLTMSVSFLIVIVVGGLGTVWGAIGGAFFVQFVPTYAADFNQSAPGVVYGVTLIVCIFVVPFGAVGLFRLVVRPLVTRQRRNTPTPSPASPDPAPRAERVTHTV